MTDWRSLFAASASQSLEFFPPRVVDGVVTVEPPPAVFEEGIREWQFSLVAQFLGKPPNFSFLYRLLSKLWEKRGFVSVKLLGSNLYLLQFANAESRDGVFEGGPWHVKNIPMILRKWEPNLRKLHFDLDCLPIWIQLHQVPLELYSKSGLSYLASSIGVPLYMDNATAAKTRLAFATICVEVKACTEIPNIIRTVLSNGSIASVAVSISWKPPCCSGCSVFGHDDSTCPKKKKVVQLWQPKATSVLHDKAVKNAQIADAIVEKDAGMVAIPSNELETAESEPAGSSTLDDSLSPTSLHPCADFQLVTKRGANTSNSKKASSSGQAKKALFTGSTNKFNALRDETLQTLIASCPDDKHDEKSQVLISDIPSTSQELWPQLVANAQTRKTRAASKGLINVLQEMKSRKAKNLAKAKQATSK